MKTYLKGIKTVAVIFLSLALFSCQDEQIEPQDTLLTESDELFSKKGNGNGGGDSTIVEYNVTLSATLETSNPTEPYTGTGLEVLVTKDYCTATNSTNSLVWFVCSSYYPVITAGSGGGVHLTPKSITLGGIRRDAKLFRVIMKDVEGNDYFADFGHDPIKPFPSEGGSWDFSELGPILVNLKYKEKGTVIYEPSGFIRIGKITLTPITP